MNKYKRSFSAAKLYSNMKPFSTFEDLVNFDDEGINYFTVKCQIIGLKYSLYPVREEIKFYNN